MKNHINIRNIEASDIPKLLDFSDKWIGKNYFSEPQLLDLIDRGKLNGLDASLVAVAVDSDQIIAMRLTLAPGKWTKVKSLKVNADLWNIDIDAAGYFKSLFIDESYQGDGLGKLLSSKSLEILKEMGAKGVVCHSWMESPNNSSQRYLEKMDFKTVSIHKKFWYLVDYDCTHCGKDTKCLCSAVEMIKYL